jgi:hypothetical protein
MLNYLAFALATLALATFGQQGVGPALPVLQEGARAPILLEPNTRGARQVNITEDLHAILVTMITDYLNRAAQHFGPSMNAPEGFEDEIVAMQPGTDYRHVVTLIGGTPYMVVGACDGDCTNIDIELIDMRTGGVVVDDVLPDDFPVVDFTPAEDGQYMVRLMMRECSLAPCYAGVRILSDRATGPSMAAPTGGDKPE